MKFITDKLHSYWNGAHFKARIIVPVLLVLTAISGFSGINFYQSEKAILFKELNDKGQNISASLAAFAINPMSSDNHAALTEYTNKLIQNQKDLNHVSFYKGNTPFITINSGSIREKLRPETLKYFKSFVNSLDNKAPAGFVRISLSTEKIEDHLDLRILQISTVSAIIVLILTFLLSWLLDKVIINPLDRMAHKIQMITHGRFNYRISADTFGEFGHLFKDINALRIKLRRKQDELVKDVEVSKKKSSLDLNTKGYKALIVDDDELILMYAQKLLEKNEMQVLLANNGREALTILKDNHVDLILLDLIMPEMTGFDVLNAIQEEADLAEIPVIVISSITDKNFIVKALNSGAVDYVIKPFNTQELLARVKTHLSASLREKELEKIIQDRINSLRDL